MATSFTTHSAGQIIASADINLIQTAVNALENTPAAGGSNGNPPDLHALKIWSSDPFWNVGGAANFSGAGNMYVYRVWSGVAQTVTSLGIMIATGGAGSSVYLALYSAGGTLLSQTGAVSSSASNAFVSGALGAAQALTAGTVYYIGVWCTGGTPPAPMLVGSSNGNSAATNLHLTAPNLRAATANTGLSTTAPGTLGTQTGTGSSFIVAGF